jgi:hypothetical protein
MPFMPKDDFFERFRALHEMDGKAPLNKGERLEYDRVKERFAEAICAAQRLVLKPGQTARATFRVPLIIKLVLTIEGAAQQTSTYDVSLSNFTTSIAKPPLEGTELPFELFLTKTEPISGRARVVETRRNQRAVLAPIDLKASFAERLERVLFDEMLRQLVKAAVRP